MRTHQYRKHISDACRNKHLSAEDIFLAVQRSCPKVGRATIYRNIECMYEKGLLRKIHGLHGKAYYENNTKAHAHLVSDRTKIFCDFPIDNVSVDNLPDGYEIAEICIHIKPIDIV